MVPRAARARTHAVDRPRASRGRVVPGGSSRHSGQVPQSLRIASRSLNPTSAIEIEIRGAAEAVAPVREHVEEIGEADEEPRLHATQLIAPCTLSTSDGVSGSSASFCCRRRELDQAHRPTTTPGASRRASASPASVTREPRSDTDRNAVSPLSRSTSARSAVSVIGRSHRSNDCNRVTAVFGSASERSPRSVTRGLVEVERLELAEAALRMRQRVERGVGNRGPSDVERGELCEPTLPPRERAHALVGDARPANVENRQRRKTGVTAREVTDPLVGNCGAVQVQLRQARQATLRSREIGETGIGDRGAHDIEIRQRHQPRVDVRQVREPAIGKQVAVNVDRLQPRENPCADRQATPHRRR